MGGGAEGVEGTLRTAPRPPLSRSSCAGKVINMNDASPEPVWPLRIASPFDVSFRQKLQYAVPGDVDKLVDEVMCSPDGEKFDSMLVRYHALYSLIDIALSIAREIASCQE